MREAAELIPAVLDLFCCPVLCFKRAPVASSPCRLGLTKLPFRFPAVLAGFFYSPSLKQRLCRRRRCVCRRHRSAYNRQKRKTGSQCVRILSAVVPGGLSFELNQCLRQGVLSLHKGRALACTEPFRIPLAGKVRSGHVTVS